MEFSKNNIIKFDTIDSTNTKAKELLEKQPNNFIVTSKIQTHGKGRLNRVWESNEGGAWFSIVAKKIKYKPQLLSFCASLAVNDTLSELNIKNIDLKWPNDVYIEGKKVCGILLESISKHKLFDVIIGIGINVNNKTPNEGISIKNILNTEIEVEHIINNTISYFNNYYYNFKNKNFNKIITKWKSHCSKINQNITIKTLTATYTGIFTDIDENGSIILEIKNENNQNKTITINEGDY